MLTTCRSKTLISITRVPGGYTRTGSTRSTGRVRAHYPRVFGACRVISSLGTGYPRVINIPVSFLLYHTSRKPFQTTHSNTFQTTHSTLNTGGVHSAHSAVLSHRHAAPVGRQRSSRRAAVPAAKKFAAAAGDPAEILAESST